MRLFVELKRQTDKHYNTLTFVMLCATILW